MIPREPMPSFFHPLCKAGWCPAERLCRPLALLTGAWHIVHWTRAPFYEMWGKPKSCREPQDVCFYYIQGRIVRQVQPAAFAVLQILFLFVIWNLFSSRRIP